LSIGGVGSVALPVVVQSVILPLAGVVSIATFVMFVKHVGRKTSAWTMLAVLVAEVFVNLTW